MHGCVDQMQYKTCIYTLSKLSKYYSMAGKKYKLKKNIK